jgi:hypothetical protein
MNGKQEVTMPTLSDATIAIKAGHNNEARAILTDILANDPQNIPALLWMTQVVLTTDERREYLRHVLAIDPNNAPAKKGLALLGEPDEIPPWMNQENHPEAEKTSASLIDTPVAKQTVRQQPIAKQAVKQQPIAQARPQPPQKKWIYTTLVVAVVLGLVLIALVYSSRPQASQTTFPTAEHTEPKAAAPRTSTILPTLKPDETTDNHVTEAEYLASVENLLNERDWGWEIQPEVTTALNVNGDLAILMTTLDVAKDTLPYTNFAVLTALTHIHAGMSCGDIKAILGTAQGLPKIKISVSSMIAKDAWSSTATCDMMMRIAKGEMSRTDYLAESHGKFLSK